MGKARKTERVLCWEGPGAMDVPPQRAFSLQETSPNGAWRFFLMDGAWFGIKPTTKISSVVQREGVNPGKLREEREVP